MDDDYWRLQGLPFRRFMDDGFSPVAGSMVQVVDIDRKTVRERYAFLKPDSRDYGRVVYPKHLRRSILTLKGVL